ncbi:probable sodium/potassium/calcium exchanger CG1090, partial [Limulus polyphemus]|uniref:Probable sodium/potassium/calcium exchanger CG1090 n=1 Tax=Limulus polyphemus TaxID=6850 RepID=A0ABM1BTV2_LIMPO
MAHRNASIPHKNGGPFSKFPYARIIQKVVFLLIAVGVSCFVLRRQPEITTSSSRGTQEVNKFHVVSGRQILSLTSRGDDFNTTSAYEPTTSSSGNDTWNNTTTPTGSMEEKCTPAAYNEFPPDLFTNQQRVRGAVIVHVLVTLYMFYALAVVCDDFFIAALEECCE